MTEALVEEALVVADLAVSQALAVPEEDVAEQEAHRSSLMQSVAVVASLHWYPLDLTARSPSFAETASPERTTNKKKWVDLKIFLRDETKDHTKSSTDLTIGPLTNTVVTATIVHHVPNTIANFHLLLARQQTCR